MSSLLDAIIFSIKVELGHPVVTVYLSDEQINAMIDKAVRKCAVSSNTLFTVSMSASSGMVDLTDLGVEAVRNVYSGVTESTTTGDIFNPLLLANMIAPERTDLGIVDYVTRIGTLSELRKLLFADYYLDGSLLYLDNYSGMVTIEYVKKSSLITFEELPSNLQAWVEGYATALCKIVEGRIRGKFKPQNSPFESNADELISEGQSEKQSFEADLSTTMGYWTIL